MRMRFLLVLALVSAYAGASQTSGYAVSVAAFVEPGTGTAVVIVNAAPMNGTIENVNVEVLTPAGKLASTRAAMGNGTNRLEVYAVPAAEGDTVRVRARVFNPAYSARRANCTASVIASVPSPVDVIKDDLQFPIGIAANSTAIFWAERCDTPWPDPGYEPQGCGRIWTAGFDGTSARVLVSDQMAPVGVVADDDAVYWTNFGSGDDDGAVMKLELESGEVTELAAGQGGLGAPILANGQLYWPGNGIWTLDSEAPLNQFGGVTLASDGAHLFWTRYATGFGPATGQVVQMPIGGGPELLLATDQPMAWDVHTDGTSVIWSNQAWQLGIAASIRRVPVGGGPVETLVEGTEIIKTFGIGAEKAYYVDNWILFEVPLSGGTPRAIAPLEQGGCPQGDIIALAGHVYWTCTCSQAVLRVTP